MKMTLKQRVLLILLHVADLFVGTFCMIWYFFWKLFHKKPKQIEKKEIKVKNYKSADK